MTSEIIFVGIAAIGFIETFKSVILHIFGNKYSVEFTTNDEHDYNYGITAWSENGAIIKALEKYRYEFNGNTISTKSMKILSIRTIKVIKLK